MVKYLAKEYIAKVCWCSCWWSLPYMMNKEDFLYLKGKIIKKYQRHQYEVELENGHRIFATLNGKLIKNKIWCSLGEDSVLCELSIYSTDKYRITKRL